MRHRVLPFMLVMLLLVSTLSPLYAAAAEELPPVQGDGRTYTVTYQGMANKQYVILILRENAGLESVDVNSILYIDQAAADSSGTVTFSNFQMKSNTSADVYIGGEDLSTPVNPYHITVSGVEVNGTVSFYGTNRLPLVTLQDAQEGDVDTVNTDSAGAYTFTGVPEGEGYKLVVTRGGYLTLTKANVTVEDGTALPTLDIKKCAGDVDGNKTINVYDLNFLLTDFNKTAGGLAKEFSDLDANGAVNVYDMNYLLGNFNRNDIAE